MSVYDNYEAVIGLEVHIQLLTKSKAYSSDKNEYGSLPNSNVSVVSLGHPGTLPKMNKKVVEYAVMLGLACECDIREENQFARKNYFYADLPKGYQITQDKTPICTGGFIRINQGSVEEKRINLTRIHMEEDAGKSIHDMDPFHTLIDLNRAGVPLLEMVSEPEIRTSEEAYQYLTEIRKLVRYLEICDGNMEEGSMRCDANISVRIKGEKLFGRRVEVKNMNSIRNVQRAIDFEIKRQIDDITVGKEISQDTRSFDAVKGITFVLRSKEMANDYRYFPEPDLPPVLVSFDYIEGIKKLMPELPQHLYKKYTEDFHLSPYDASVLTDQKQIALYFEELIRHTKNYKAACNWVMGPIKSYLNENAISIEKFPITPGSFASLIALIEGGQISFTIAQQKLFPEMLRNPEVSPEILAKDLNLLISEDKESLQKIIEQVLGKYPEKIREYKNGKTSLIGLFMGEVMKLSKGKADPKNASEMVKNYLDNFQI